ncbi:hypothetical protein [Mesobacillus foraminis]|nr:hypothetical protein [Mesobacillus foraminis]
MKNQCPDCESGARNVRTDRGGWSFHVEKVRGPNYCIRDASGARAETGWT